MFENTSLITVEELKKLQKFTTGKSWLLIVCAPIILVCSILLFVFHVVWGGVIALILGLLALAAYGVVIYGNIRSKKQFIASGIKTYNYKFNDLSFTVTASKDSTDTENEVFYKDVYSVKNYDGLFFIFLDTNSAYVLKEDGFTQGRAANFLDFMEEKMRLDSEITIGSKE